MKLQLLSDLHLEMNPTYRPSNSGSDVLVLSGDICVANFLTKSEASPYHKYKMLFHEFFKHCSENWKYVVYVSGNHEHYHGRFNDTTEILKNFLAEFPNVYHLDDESVELDEVLFVGTTLWTDLNKYNPVTSSVVQGSMNDYHVVTFKDGSTYRKLTPMDTVKANKKAVEYVETASDGHSKVVVVGHHTPTELSVAKEFKNDYHMNFAYHNDLWYFIEGKPQIKLWTCGHTHHAHKYYVGETLVACNPKGYPDQKTGFYEGMVLEV